MGSLARAIATHWALVPTITTHCTIIYTANYYQTKNIFAGITIAHEDIFFNVARIKCFNCNGKLNKERSLFSWLMISSI